VDGTVSKQEIKDEYFECYGVYNIGIYDGKRLVGRAILLNTPDLEELVLLDIYVYNEEDRRKGYADKLMWFLTQRHDAMITSWLTTAGRDLCLKHGFFMMKSAFKNQIDLLGYRKESPDGSEEGGGQEEGPGKEEGGTPALRQGGQADQHREAGAAGDGAGSEDGQDAEEDPQSAESQKEG